MLTTIAQGARAAWAEVCGFRFSYPLAVVQEAGPKDSLHYYLYGKNLSWAALRLDPSGVPLLQQRLTGEVYNPAFIASYGLTNLGHYLRNQEPLYLNVFLRQVDWLEKNAVVRGDGSIVWVNNFDYREGNVFLRGPWVSANLQGFAISALIRGWRLLRRNSLVALLNKSADVYKVDVQRGGIRALLDDRVTYSEKPGLPPPGILDGFMRSLLGLYDLFIEFGDSTVKELFDQGIEGLKYALVQWDYKGKWSWYGNRYYLSPPPYHYLNCSLLSILGRLTGDRYFARTAESWNSGSMKPIDRGEVYLMHLITKNSCRLKYRTWNHKSLRTNVKIEGSLAGSWISAEELSEERERQILSLTGVGWSIDRIERATGIRRDAVRLFLEGKRQTNVSDWA